MCQYEKITSRSYTETEIRMVSVIVPIYNVEKYVGKCVDSIINQTHAELEIILVDDGSTDSSGKICDALKQQDERISVIHKENGGLSDARNCGIDHAAGEWVVFIDGDDFIHPHMIERLYQLAEQYDSDIVACGFEPVLEAEEIRPMEQTQKEAVHIYETNDIFAQFGRLEITLAWNKIYRKNLFDTIRYPKGRVHEDEYIIHHLAGECKRLVYTEEKLYYYLTRNGSIMSKVTKQRIEDIAYALKNRIAYYGEKGFYGLRRRSCNELVNSLIMCGYHSKDYDLLQKKKLLQYINLQLVECQDLYEKEIDSNYRKQIKLFLRNPARCYSYRKKKEYLNKIRGRLKRVFYKA